MISKIRKTHLGILYQSTSPFNTHCASASNHLVDPAFGCVPVSVARLVAAEAAKASWNRAINFGIRAKNGVHYIFDVRDSKVFREKTR